MTIDPTALLRLQAWLSPSFPIGGFSYSHGLEQAIEYGWATDRDSLIDWLEADLSEGAGLQDAILLAAAWRAVTDNDPACLIAAAELSASLRGSAEFALESSAQGKAFLRTIRQAWPHPALDTFADTLRARDIQATLAIAVGATGAAHGVPLETTQLLYLHAVVAGLVNAAVRLIPLGQTDGQRVIAALEAPIIETARRGLTENPEDIGSATLMIDIVSMRHETQHTRLFRS